MGPIAKAFVIANRIFGWGTAVAGVSVLLGVVQRIALGRAGGIGLGWHVLIGVLLVVVGVVYIRAPLYRSITKDQGSSAD